MLLRILAARAPLLTILFLAAGVMPGAAQFRDARLPESGQLWLELTPTLLDWSHQFAENSPDPDVPDGSREPLFADYDGPIAARLFPGPDFLIDDLNADAAALGFDPVTAADFSLGDLDFSSIHTQVRRVELGFELGILDRLSVGFRAPFTLTDVEASSVFDSTTASVTLAAAALPPGGQFFMDTQSSLTSLQALIDGGSLTGTALADAMALRADADAFLTALERRGMAGALIPTAPSAAGIQMAQRFGQFISGFEALGLTLPALGLPQTGTSADFSALFGNSPISAFRPGNSQTGLTLGEIEVSVRFGLIDQVTPRRQVAEPATDRAIYDSTGAADAPDASGAASIRSPAASSRSVRLRTSLGVTARIPIRSASFPPFENAADFLDVPIGDGQTDIELALYQDIAFGDWLMVRASARYGIQMADDLILRVAPPDRPYALESLQTVVHRDLGDYFLLLVRPSLRLNSAISLGLEYEYFRLGRPSYTLAGSSPDVPDASPLEIEGSQTRGRIGLGFLFDLTEARDRDGLIAGAGPVRRPLQFGISIRRAISGSGGQTPASFRFGADFRVPIDIF